MKRIQKLLLLIFFLSFSYSNSSSTIDGLLDFQACDDTACTPVRIDLMYKFDNADDSKIIIQDMNTRTNFSDYWGELKILGFDKSEYIEGDKLQFHLDFNIKENYHIFLIPRGSRMKQESGLTKKVYVPMAADLLHEGHLNIINEAKKLGKVVVGLLTDKAIAEYKEIPILNYEQRKIVMESIMGIDLVVEQKTWDYEPVLRDLKPDFLVHGDDWKTGPQKEMRLKCITIIGEWKGKVIDIPYTKGISTTQITKNIKSRFLMWILFV